MCKRLKFDHTTKRYKLESVFDNETHKIRRDFEIQNRLFNPSNKKKKKEKKKRITCHVVIFSVLADHKGKIKESEKRDKYSNPTRKLSYGGTNCRSNARNGFKNLERKTRRIENQRKNQHPPDDSIIQTGQNTEESHGDMRRLAVTQTLRWWETTTTTTIILIIGGLRRFAVTQSQ